MMRQTLSWFRPPPVSKSLTTDTIKYEEVYLRAYDGVEEARQSIGRYIAFYNARRPHAALDVRTPDQAYSHPLPLRTAA